MPAKPHLLVVRAPFYEDIIAELTRGAVMHEGTVSLVLGLPGMPSAAEDVMTGRDISLAEATGGRREMVARSAPAKSNSPPDSATDRGNRRR